MVDASGVLVPPVAHAPIPDSLDHYLHIADLVSLGHWALKAIDMMGGPNLPDEIGEWFAGDWSEVSRSADALRHLGQFCMDSSNGVTLAVGGAQWNWSGKAADAAGAYFATVSASLTEQRDNFDDIADQFDLTAFGVYETAKAVGDMVESLVDYAIAAGVSLAAGAATSETIIGGIIGGGAAGYSVYKGAKVVKEIIELRAKVWNVCEALLGLIAGSLSSIQGFSAVSLPSGYDNPQVSR